MAEELATASTKITDPEVEPAKATAESSEEKEASQTDQAKPNSATKPASSSTEEAQKLVVPGPILCGRCKNDCSEENDLPNPVPIAGPCPTNYRPRRAPAVLTPPNTEQIKNSPVPQALPVPGVSLPHEFWAPRSCISSISDIEHFHESFCGKHFLGFVVALSDAIKGHKISDECPVSDTVLGICEILGILEAWIDELPPSSSQAARFGNPVFREWHERLENRGPELLRRVAPSESLVEISAYFADSFGSAARIDYGTGHETNFAAFLFCLARLGIVTENDYQAIVSRAFVKYLSLMRKLQMTYTLEPAGSHGVWGLDDYHFLPFIFGSSQLVGHKYMKPKSIHNPDILENFSQEYMYLACVRFVKETKKGHLAEHSPMIDDISSVPNWAKVNSGMLKMYKAEVLEKVPIMQHFLFGTLISWE